MKNLQFLFQISFHLIQKKVNSWWFVIFQAIDYSKNIPKPNVKPRPNQYNSYEVAAQLSPAAKRSGPSSPTQTVDVIDLQKLKNRHDQEKQNVASIRQNMETVPQKA